VPMYIKTWWVSCMQWQFYVFCSVCFGSVLKKTAASI